MDFMEFALKAGISVLAGLCIGLEREFRGKQAGLKTNALVALGATIYLLMSLQFEGEDYADMTRVLSQVIIGIGFIGAGTIMKKGNDVEGLTTAATIWCSAAVGCLSGFGLFKELALITIMVIALNYIFSLVEKKMIEKKKEKKKKKKD
ncbi:MgtC/SapB family protein [Christiangramia salexigens]|uniref:Magnesium transporter MgtC n=1 Tax=Christiangramia salexigens TaxID=1913577 RepID=A0A1L3J653_9FLAO|nr:MgtC/SapB family protein [Christiangramia salexigens]APG60584.1 magnesium transporter MgtC [Christiangramia salexigens]